MEFTNNIVKINKVLKPYYELIGTIVLFYTCFIFLQQFIFQNSDLSVEVIKDDFDYPAIIHKKFESVLEKIDTLFIKYPSAIDSATRISFSNSTDFLIHTRNKWKITIKNQSKNTCEDLNIRITDINLITSVNISSDYLSNTEIDEILKSKLQIYGRTFTINKLTSLPIGKTINIYLWGQLPDATWIENVIVNYNGGDGRINQSRLINGFELYIADNFLMLFIFIIFAFSIIQYLTIKKYKN